MRWLRHLIVATANLAEAEGRALRKVIFRVTFALALLLAFLAFAGAGFGLALAAMFRGLTDVWHPGWALLTCAGVCVVFAIGLAWGTARLAK